MASRQDLITLVLESLGVLAAGQSASAEDRDAVNRRIDPKLAELARREVMTGLSADSLDPAVLLYVADIVAYACRTPFGIVGAKADLLAKAAGEAEATLKAMARQFIAGAASAAYDIVQDVLEQLGVVSPGQTPSEQDRGVVGARIPPMLADLRQREIIAFSDLSGADVAHRRHLATILVASCAPTFGANAAGLFEAAAAAEQQLRALARQFDAGVGTSGTFSVPQSVLELLGVVAGGQTATAKDVAVVTARYVPLLADLRARHIVDLPSVDGADSATKHHLAVLLASRCALLFGVSEPLLTGLRAEEMRAEAGLRAIARQLDTGSATSGTLDLAQAVLEGLGVVAAGQTATAKDVAVVTARQAPLLADLRARDIIDLADFATAPAATKPHLVALLTATCAPLFGVAGAALDAMRVGVATAESALRLIARQVDTGVATSGTFDLVQSALEMLGVVAGGQTAGTKDRAVVSARVPVLLADLRDRDVIALASIDAASASTRLHLAAILASRCARLFALPEVLVSGLKAEALEAEAALRRIARQVDAGAASQAAYDAVQAVLERLGVVAAGQTGTAADRNAVAVRVAPVLADLRRREVIDLPDLAGADAGALIQVTTLLAAACAEAFDIDPVARAALAAQVPGAEAALRLVARQLDTGVGTSGTFDPIQAALEALGVVAAGQTASGKDRAVVSARVAPVLADLRNREVLAIPSLAAADAGTLVHLSVILAAACAEAFGAPAPIAASLLERAGRAEAALNAAARQLDTGPGTAGTFDAVQVVLETLGVIAPGQSGSAKDRAAISARVPVVLADLKAREIADVTTLAAAPAAYQPSLATIIAAACAAAFQIPAEARGALAAAAGQAEVDLRRMARQFDAGAGTGSQFDAIQNVLETLGVVEAGQSATAADRAVVMSRVAPLLADLRRRDIIDVASLGAADAGVQLHLAGVLASWCAAPFKIAGETLVAVKTGAAQAEAALRLIGRQLDGGIATGGTFDVVQAVLENLDVVAAGYTGSAKDRAVVAARVVPTLADLRLREIASIASLEAADPGVLIHLSVILTSACAQAFGKDAATRTLLAAEAVKAEAALRALARQLDAGAGTSGVYDVVQAALEMLGVIEPGQTGSDKDRAVVLARVQPKLLELYGRDICGVTDLSQLTPELQGAFARVLAADCLLAFPTVPAPRAAMLLGMVAGAEGILRYQSFVYDARPALRIEPFWGRRRCRAIV